MRMQKKTKPKNTDSGIVYSTDPRFQYQQNDEDEAETLPPDQQDLRIRLDKRHRKGKEVTLVTGFVGSEADLKDLGRSIKNKMGVGGSVKNGELLIQGDLRNEVIKWLGGKGYHVKKSGG
jgi:translation initiation factor 1